MPDFRLIWNKISLLFVLFSAAHFSIAQKLNALIYNYENGLNLQTANSIVFDNNNKPWISAPQENIFHFDLGTFKKVSGLEQTGDNNACILIKDYKDSIWFINYRLPNFKFAKIHNSESASLSKIFVSIPMLHFETRNVIVQYHGDTAILFVFFSNFIYSVNTVSKTVQHYLNVSTNNVNRVKNEIYFSDNHGFGLLKLSQGKASKEYFRKTNNVINFDFNFQDSRFYYATSKGLYSYKFNEEALNVCELNIKTNVSKVQFAFSKSSIFIYTESEILFVNLISLKAEKLDRSNGLLTNGAYQIQNDKENNMWICQQGGVVKIPAFRIQHWSGHDFGFTTDAISACKSFKDGIIVASNSEISVQNFKLNSRKNYSIQTENKTLVSRILDIAYVNNAIYFVDYNKAWRIHQNNLLEVLNSKIGGYLSLIPHQSKLYFLQLRRLNEYDYETGKNKEIELKDIDQYTKIGVFRKLFSYSANQLMIVTSTGIIKFNTNLFKIDEFIPSSSAYYFLRTKTGKELIACIDGVFELQEKKLIRLQCLPKISYFALAEDKWGKIWVGSNQGVYVIEQKKNNFELVNHVQSKVGLIGIEVNRGAFEIDENGMLIVGTNNGLNFIQTELKTEKSALKVIVNLLVNNNKINALKTQFSHKENNLKFEINLYSFIGKGYNLFNYRILGLRDSWSGFEEKSVIELENLAPGKYQLEIIGKNAMGQITDPYIFAFTVHPPWYKTLWFYLLFGTIIVLLLGWSIKLIVKRIKTRYARENEALELQKQLVTNELKMLRMQVNPHALGNTLQILQKHIIKKETPEALNLIGSYAQYLRNLLEMNEQDYILLKNEISLLEEYIELQQHRLRSDFSYSIQVDSNLDTDIVYIPSLMLQPFVENAINYGLINKLEGQQVLKIQFVLQGNVVIVSIADNGIGREKHTQLSKKVKGKSLGNTLILSRLRLLEKQTGINTQLEFVDLQNGLEVRMTLPNKIKADESSRN